MTNRIDRLIQRTAAFALSAIVTAVVLASIDGLASRDVAADALLAQQTITARTI